MTNGLGRVSNLTFEIKGPVSEDIMLNKLANDWEGYRRPKRSTKDHVTFNDANNLEYFIAVIKTTNVDGEPAPELKGKLIGYSGIAYYSDILADGGSYVFRGSDETMKNAGKEVLIDAPSFRQNENSVYKALGETRNAYAISKLGDKPLVIAFSSTLPSFYANNPDWETNGRNIPEWALERLDAKKGKMWTVYTPLSGGAIPNVDVSKSFNKIWKSTIKKVMGNPDSIGHIRTLPVEQQKRRRDTWDYCERVAVLDCKRCDQKLCNMHINKPCAPPEKRQGGYRWG